MASPWVLGVGLQKQGRHTSEQDDSSPSWPVQLGVSPGPPVCSSLYFPCGLTSLYSHDP